MLKKEVMKTQSKDLEKGAEYRQLLVQVGRIMAPCAGRGRVAFTHCTAPQARTP